MTGEVIAQVGTVIVALIAFYAAVVKSKPTAPEGRSASASEVESLGKRLDAQNVRMDAQDRLIRGLYAYIALDHAEHRAHGWAVTPLPEDLA